MRPRLVVVAAALAAVGLASCGSSPRPRVRSGPLPFLPPRDEIAETMASASDSINGCVNGMRSGTVHASVVFAPHGLVSSVEVERWDAPVDEVAMRSCVIDVLYGLRVSPFVGKELLVEVAYDLW